VPKLELDSEEESVVGWTSAQSVLDTDLRKDKIYFREYLIVSMRVDAWKVPTALVKAYAQEEERKKLQEDKRETLSRRERSELQEAVRLTLKKKILPSISTFDVCWDLKRGILRFWSHSNRVNELFLELFEKTFDLPLVLQSPFTLAQQCASQEVLDKVVQLEPLCFAAERS
ncbi:MAG: recombination-associated protein RdgC, partial [Myxococcota bacterium]